MQSTKFEPRHQRTDCRDTRPRSAADPDRPRQRGDRI